jgi:LPXTG-motif cell wall-anchored protein
MSELSDTSSLDQTLSWFGSLLQPALNQAVLGTPAATQLELNRQRLEWARLNGSGPNNPNMAMGVPASWWDFFFGTKANASDIGSTGTRGMWPLVLGVVLLVGLLFFIRRR